MTRTRYTGMVTLGFVTAALLVSPTGSAVASQREQRGVCAGVSRCHIAARSDVNGDGSRDPIGVARRGDEGAPKGAVIVRVKTGPRRIESIRRPLQYWYGPVWQGVANLTRTDGKEIVVARTSGAHTLLYQTLTWRQGRLDVLTAPGQGNLWAVDSAATITMGWLRRPSDPPGRVTKRTAYRMDVEGPFKGKIAEFQWTRDGWRKVASRTISPLSQRRAYKWAGFHVPGLPRW
jgi:hypothetical protein